MFVLPFAQVDSSKTLAVDERIIDPWREERIQLGELDVQVVAHETRHGRTGADLSQLRGRESRVGVDAVLVEIPIAEFQVPELSGH